MSNPTSVQAQVKLADIKRLLMDNVCQFYLCHNVAHLLEPNLEKVFPEYREFANEGMDGLIGYNGIAYYFLCEREYVTDLDHQVVSCIQNYMREIDHDSCAGVYQPSAIYLFRHTMMKFLGITNGSNWTGRRLRIDTLGKILSVYPDATMPIEIKV